MNEAKKKISFKQFSRKTKIISITSLSALILTATLAGAQVATSANGVIEPKEIMLKEYTGGPPATPVSFMKLEGTGSTNFFLEASDNASIVAATPKNSYLYIKETIGSEVKVTEFKTTAECSQSANISSLKMSAEGSKIMLTASGNLFACLNGITEPKYLTAIPKIWLFSKEASGEWVIELVEESLNMCAALKPAMNDNGEQIFFAAKNIGLPKFEMNQCDIYSKNLLTNEIQSISDYSETGGRTSTNASSIIVSSSGRYVGWQTQPSSYTSRMLSDEVYSSLNNWVYSDRGINQDKSDLQLLPYPDITVRKGGRILAFKENAQDVSVLYNSAAKNSSGVEMTSSYSYSPIEHKLYKISDEAFNEVSRNAKYAYSTVPGAGRLYSLPLENENQVITWQSAALPSIGFVTMADDRIFYANLTYNPYTSYNDSEVFELGIKW